MTTRNRTLVVGTRIERELVGEVDCPTPVAEPAKHLTVGIAITACPPRFFTVPVGYRNSLTEIVQIIGRVTRDAPGKAKARFTNLIAEPMAAQADVVEAVNDTLKAIAASLLMEQVLAPKFDFTPKNAGPQPGFDYAADGYKEGQTNVGVDETNGRINVEIAGLKEAGSEAARICREDFNDVIAAFVQDNESLSKGLFDTENTLPQETTQVRIAKIVRDRCRAALKRVLAHSRCRRATTQASN